MPVILNMIGLGCLVVGVLAGVGLGAVFGARALPLQCLSVGLGLTGLDLLYRLVIYRGAGVELPADVDSDSAEAARELLENLSAAAGERRGLFHPRKGGHFFFIPAWIWGLPMLALAILLIAAKGFFIS